MVDGRLIFPYELSVRVRSVTASGVIRMSIYFASHTYNLLPTFAHHHLIYVIPILLSRSRSFTNRYLGPSLFHA